MPTYDYRCRDCGHTIEIIHSILEDGPEVCERCRGPMQRVLHPTGVIFRGSGFYVTDSRSAHETASRDSAASPAEKGSSAEGGGSAEGGSSSGGGDSAPAGSTGGTPKE
ncbi:MAG: FmdB family transcriptional regulator [Chloroflexota bacterium]|nr:FmdB family transcriptional regulator [Chloroflexota bacterium]